jgi:glycerophosphoryl diester phosphodiesterase
MVKERMPRLEVSWLVSSDSKTKEFPPIREIVAKAKAAGLDGLDLDSGFPIDKQFVETVRNAGLKLYTWTVDDPVVAKTEVLAGVDGITTNRPEWLRKQLSLAAP